MKRDLICIICPRGCALSVSGEGKDLNVTGNACPKGLEYAINECTNPMRTVTSTVRLSNRPGMVSVKTEAPIAKGKMAELMTLIRAAEIAAPVKIGDTVIEDALGVRIIATKNVD